jgi:hypothetical protein
MLEEANFIFALILLIINLVMCYKKIPIIGVPISILTWFLCAFIFIGDSNIPANPYFTLLLGLIATGSIIINASIVRGNKK